MSFKKKISVIGGGTGTYTVLRGLKKKNVDLTAIVSMFDSGKSTGILRDEYGILPPGDIRRCLLALADERKNEFLRLLFDFRFLNGSVSPHNLGNLIMKAAEDIKGDYILGIEELSKLFNIKGRVLPVTTQNANLLALLEDGTHILGETNIDIPKHDTNVRIKELSLSSKCVVHEDTERALTYSDIIVIGPGDLYTSIIPNLLVDGVREAIMKKALVVYVCNLVTKKGETDSFSVQDHVRIVKKYLKGDIDYVIANSKIPTQETIKRYESEGSFIVKLEDDDMEGRIKLFEVASSTELYRHDSDKLAEV